MLSIIVAFDNHNVIGYQNKLPWQLPADLRRLKAKTCGHTIVMGRHTFDSIGRALPGRRTIVLSRNTDFVHPTVETVHDIEEIVRRYQSTSDEVFVFGGGEVYRQLMPFCRKIYLTVIDDHFIGDCTFPIIDPYDWQVTEQIAGIKDQDNPYDYMFVTFERRKKFV